jgi:hypothetical protein
MAYEYDLTLTINDEETVTQKGSFQEEEWNLLNEFLGYAEELLKTEYVRDGMPAEMNINLGQSSGTVSTKLPDWDDVTVFLHKFRPIGLQSESTNCYRICNILTKELVHPYFRNLIGQQREVYSGKRAQSAFTIMSNDVVLNSEKVLYDWLNSFEYHRDKEKRQFIESLHQMIPMDASKVLFIGLLADRAEAINNLAALISVIVGRQNSARGQIRLSK